MRGTGAELRSSRKNSGLGRYPSKDAVTSERQASQSGALRRSGEGATGLSIPSLA